EGAATAGAAGSSPAESQPTATCPAAAPAPGAAGSESKAARGETTAEKAQGEKAAGSESKAGGGDKAADKASGTKKGAAGSSSSGQKFDQAVVSAGQAAFERDCTKCHEASRALERTKDLAGWRATVRRMAARRGADIPSEDLEPITTYLASRGTQAAGGT